MWHKTDDGSVIDATGKVIFFSTERFVKDICLGECCFICGAEPADKLFNNEHILPEWLLRTYDLFQKTIVLPNGATVRYGQYTLQCCAECNAHMGQVIEQPISRVVRGGAEEVNRFLESGGTLQLFVWMGLIYLKTHLRDRKFRIHLDARNGDAKIADEYDWEHLHNVHSIVRCFYTGAEVDPGAVGSLLSISVNAVGTTDRFDFCDLYLAQTMLLRLENLGLLAVFNDSCGALSYFRKILPRITGPLSEVQLREVLVEFAALNLRLRDRPIYYTEMDLPREVSRVRVKRPKLALSENDLVLRGQLFEHALRHVIHQIRIPGWADDDVLKAVRAGKLSLLFDNEGLFIQGGFMPS